MIFGKTKLEFKLGIFVFIGIVILVSFILLIGSLKTWSQDYRVNFIFNFVNGVKVGAPVRFSGVDVGEVKSLNFINPDGVTKIQIVATIKKEVRIPVDSTVWVNTLGLLGEKYVEVMPGKDTSNYLSNGQELAGVDPIPMQELSVLAKKIADHVDESIVRINNKEGTVGKLLYDDTIYKELEALVVDLRKHPWKLFWKTKEKK